MGMYTELQGTIVFKTEEIAEAFCSEHHQWEEIYKLTKNALVKNFINYSRSTWIPNGDAISDGCVVKFRTELKDYDDTIEEFCKLLPEIANNWILQERYEEHSWWELIKKGNSRSRINGDNYYEQECSYPRLKKITYPRYDVFDENNL